MYLYLTPFVLKLNKLLGYSTHLRLARILSYTMAWDSTGLLRSWIESLKHPFASIVSNSRKPFIC